LRAHTELQRLNEEFLQVDRVRRLLVPMTVNRRLTTAKPEQIGMLDRGGGASGGAALAPHWPAAT
jgi:hypothetical protein